MPRERPSRRRLLAAGLGLLSGCVGTRRSAPESRSDRRPTADATLALAGDVMLGRGVDAANADAPPGRVWGDLLARLDAADGLLVNLECVLSTRGAPAPGRTYRFRADPAWAGPALRRADAGFASLANNHVLDFGPHALADTRAALDAAGVAHAGAGPDHRSAHAPARFTAGDLEVAVVAATDQTPSYAAGPASPGTAFLPMAGDPLTRTALAAAMTAARRAEPDLLVASLHWGPNWITEPAPRYRELARWLVDAGADVVHGHGAHVPQGVEVHRGRPILHDCGDLVDDYAVVGDLHNDRSVLVELDVADGVPTALRLVPVVIDDAAVRLASGPAAAWLRARLRARSAELGTDLARDGEALVARLG